MPSEPRPIGQCSGQILREDIYAERDNPPFDRVCMDGIAVSSSAFARGRRRFAIEATQAAGAPALQLSHPEGAIEVMTGAVLPAGTDCIIPQEEYALAEGHATVKAAASGKPDRNVQRRGEDSARGVPMLRAGALLGAPQLAVVASAGLASIAVSRQPRCMVISTGDELIEPGQPIAAHQVRRSNAYAVLACLRGRGFEQVADDHILDDEGMLHRRLAQHLAREDVLILSGGVSKGKFDLVPKVLKGLGVAEVFYQVAQRPGMPMWFGVGPEGQAVFGVPGNPVATLVCVVRYVIAALAHTMGASPLLPETAVLAEPLKFHRPVAYFLPVSVKFDHQGRRVALPRPPNGPGDFLALTGADGFVELPPREDAFPQDFVAEFYRW
jgi:molybdopterin molybdotransferase